MATLWKKGRGKLGVLTPLLGTWVAHADSPMGPVKCVRNFTLGVGGAFLELRADWTMGAKHYHELAIFGVGDDGALAFWSFTSDGKRSTGTRVDAPDQHPEAIAFEAEMPAGTARMIYWPGPAGGFHWAVESKNRKGWHRFTEHHYQPV